MGERMKILKMLEEGKISSDEAAKLLEAVGKGKGDDLSSRIVESVVHGISSIVGAIPGTLNNAFSITVSEKKEMKVKKGDCFSLKSVGSAVTFDIVDGDTIIIKPSSGLVRTKKENATIDSKIVGGTMDVIYPESLAVCIKDAGGTIEGKGSATLSMKQVGGSARLSFDKIDDVSIDSKGGSLTLYLGDCDVSFDISAPHGEITFDVSAEFSEKSKDCVKGTIKNGKGTLLIRSFSGDVSVLPLKRKEKK